MNARKWIIALACVTSIAACSDITMSNDVGDTPQGRAQIVSFVEPGETTISEVRREFGSPVAVQGLGRDSMQANYQRYFGTSGYASVKYNKRSGVVFGVEAFSYDQEAQRFSLEAEKP